MPASGRASHFVACEVSFGLGPGPERAILRSDMRAVTTLLTGVLVLLVAGPGRAETDLSSEPPRHQLAVKGGYQSLLDANEIKPTDLEPDDFSGLALDLAYQYGVSPNVAFGVDYLAIRQDEQYGLAGGRGEMNFMVNALMFTTFWRSDPPNRSAFHAGAGIGLYSAEIRFQTPSEQISNTLVNVKESGLSFGAHLVAGYSVPLVSGFGIGVENRAGWSEFDLGRAGHINLAHNLTSLFAAWNF